ncbi:MAG: response regulator [Desulfobacterales bacterium]|nr:response regulator [Desulfobacterales bacterium]MCP4159080.1 response regulator [Deltaproteobacteria bacterium]
MNNDNSLILIADDSPTNISLLINTLKDDYILGIAKSGQKLLDLVQKKLPDLILLDIQMPEMDGYEVCKRLQDDPETQEIPIIFITAMTDVEDKTMGFKIGAVDYITKPFHSAEVIARVKTHLSRKKMREELNAQNIILEEKVKEKTEVIQKMLGATIHAMVLTVESRDPYTAGHQERVAQFACDIASEMGLSKDNIEGLRLAALLHDIGKIRVPVAILNRPKKLLDVEFDMLKIHPEIGYNILKNIPSPWPFAEIAHQHHERLDGSGYPQGLKGDEILLEARILAVADVIEAMSSHRPYRAALGINAALAEIQKYKNIHFDPDVVDAALQVLRK